MLNTLNKFLTALFASVSLFALNTGMAMSGPEKTELSFTLQQVEATLRQWQDEQNTRRPRADSERLIPDSLPALMDQLKSHDEQIEADFAAALEQVRDLNLPLIIHQRHQTTVDDYRLKMATLLDNLEAVSASDDNRHTKRALKHIQSLRKSDDYPRFDQDQLPVGLSKAMQQAPLETKAELNEWFFGSNNPVPPDTKRAKRDGQGEPNPFITPDIQAIAQELGHNPVKVFNFVHDNIAFVPTYGAIQAPQMTLDMKRGNPWDIALLLKALLNASNIEAKLVLGTVSIDIERLINWLGVNDATSARNLLAQGGVPNTAQISAGKIKRLKIEHCWISAWVDFIPSGGARHRKGDTWIPLDASFKQHTLTKGTNLTEVVPFDIEVLRSHLLATTQIDDNGGVTDIDTSYMEQAISSYQTELQNYLDLNDLDPANFLDQKTIIPANRPELAASLPYQLIAQSERADEIPAHLTHRITIKFYHSRMAQTLDNPTLSDTLPLPTLGSQRLNVTYVPATEADAQALEKIRASGTFDLPLYLFQVKPVLKLDDTVLAEGTAIGMGQPQYYTVILQGPHNNSAGNGTATAGDEIVFGVNASGITPQLVQKRLDQVPSNTAAENMHQAGLHFWMQHDLFDNLAAQAYQVHVQRMPSVGTFSIPLSVNYFFGIPRSGNYRSRQVDVKLNLQIVRADTNAARFLFLSTIGMHGSYLEGAVLDQLFGRQRYRGISATQLLMEANSQGVPIYTITKANVNTILPILAVSGEVKSDIINAVHAGKQAIVPQRELVHGNWKGTGYIIQDLITGEGAYLLEGGLNGGGHELCFISVAQPVHPMSPISQVTQQLLNQAFSTFLFTYFSLIEQVISEEIADIEAQEKMNIAFRALEATVTEIVTNPSAVKTGCLRIHANGTQQPRLYVPFERDPETGELKEEVSVHFSSEISEHCFEPVWHFGDDETSTEPNPTHTYTEPGLYHVTLKAKCDEEPSPKKAIREGVKLTEEQVDTETLPFRIEFIDHSPSLGESHNSDNYFLRGITNVENLKIYYRIEPESLDISVVKINIYEGTWESEFMQPAPEPIETLEGPKWDGKFIGPDLFVEWTPPIEVREDHPGFYRVQLEVYAQGPWIEYTYGDSPLEKTSIEDDDNNSKNGWQCPNDGLAIHDLVWKHRPMVNIHEDEIGAPTSVEKFVKNSKVEEWKSTIVYDPSTDTYDVRWELKQNPTDQSVYSFYDFLADGKISSGQFEDYLDEIIKKFQTDEAAIYYSANTGDADNFIFLQYWMFENFSGTGFNIIGGTADQEIQHEGDVEYVQIAIRLRNPDDKSNPAQWLVPFAATASQHYYAQTLQWDIYQGEKAPNPYSQEQVEHHNGRLEIYIAQNSHATYFAEGHIVVPGIFDDLKVGTQVQYNPVGSLDGYDKTAPAYPIDYKLIPLNQAKGEFDTFKGYWGYYDNQIFPAFSDGPPGPPRRQADGPAGKIHLRDNPKALHNGARKKNSLQFEKMFIK